MLDEHERHVPELGQCVAHRLRAGGIEVRRRLVEQEQTRPQRERTGDRETLFLAT